MTAKSAIRLPDPWLYRGEPPQERIYERSKTLDGLADWVTDDVTFNSLRNLIRSADDGDYAETLQAFSEMEQKDAKLLGIANTRRSALTGLEWEITSASESEKFKGDKGLADEAAAYVNDVFEGIEATSQSPAEQGGFEEFLEHMASAIGPGLSVTEIEWRRHHIKHLLPIPVNRITANPEDNSELWIITDDEQQGFPMDPRKFIFHVPHSKPGFGYTRSISHAIAMVYLVKLHAAVDWGMYVHRFGVPFIMAERPKQFSPADATKLENMLKGWGTGGWAHFQEGIKMTLVESAQRGVAPQEAILEWCGREMAIAFLGQTLTTEPGESGSYSLGQVHNLVREDLLRDDIKKEGRTLRRQLIKPLCLYQYPGRNVPYPYFNRIIDEPVDRKLEGEVIRLAQQSGMRISKSWAYETLGIQEPKDANDVLEPPDLTEEGPAPGW